MESMAIPYFPLECALDDKFELIEAEFGLNGFAVIVKLFQRIYGGEGYYTPWTKDVALVFARKIGLGANAVSEIVTASVRRGIFDRTLYDKYQILTSKGIQERYFDAVKRRKELKVTEAYLLVPHAFKTKNADISVENAHKKEKNADISQQRREEKRREEKRREENTGGASLTSEEIIALFNRICTALPRVSTLTMEREEKICCCDELIKGDWEALFNKVRCSDFLTGKIKDWRADFDWILEHSIKILEGSYDNPTERNGRKLIENLDELTTEAIMRFQNGGRV